MALLLVPVGAAWGATVIDGPIELGTSASFGVLAGSAVTSTGPTTIDANVGVSPSSPITGFPPGTISPPTSAFHSADTVSAQAQADLDAAMLTAASLTPNVSGLANLTGMSLVPGVYSGGALSLDAAGTLTLAGTDPTSVWVFTAASTLITGSVSEIVITGGASACNVFWLVGSSATFGTGTQFAGTVMAEQSITATTSTAIVGRLLARNGAVSLDTTQVTVPTSCTTPAGTVSTTGSPEFTSGLPPAGTAGTPYSFSYTATGTPAVGFAVTAGALPAGLSLDSTTGVVSGTPLGAGTSVFTVTASNTVAPVAAVVSTLVIAAAASAPTLPPTGVEPVAALPPLAALLVGLALVLVGYRARPRHRLAR